MPLITHLKIKYKLGLMLFFPMVGLLYFSIILMIEKAQTAHDMGGLAELTQLSITLSHIVHAVQLERGASSLFLKKQGQKFADELSEYRTQTDESITALNHFLQGFDIHYYNTDFNTRLNNVKKTLTRFQSIRVDVTALSIPQPDAVKRYTNINQTLFQFIIQSTHISSYKDVFPLKLAYINLLKIKEKAGLERALLAAVFSQDYLIPEQFQKFVEIKAVQEAYLNHDVMNYLTDEQKTFLGQQLSAGPFIEETTRMREIVYTAAKKGRLPEEVDPEYWFAMQTGKINLLKKAGDKLAHDLYVKADDTQKTAQTEFISFLILMIVIVGLATLFFVLMLTNTLKGLNQAIKVANQIASGNLNNHIDTYRQDETGQLSQAFASMQTQLRERIELNKRIADEALRITCALDSATTNILITNANYQIIYLNETAQQLFKTYESSIRKDLPHFEVSRLYGANLDLFHKDAAKQGQILAKLTNSHHVKITLGGLSLDHIITPIINANGERLGLVIEFNNRTFEEALASEINQVIHAASQGDFQQRLNLEDKTGFFKIFSTGINQIMAFNQRVVLDITHIIAALAKGDLTQQIENNYVGIFEQLKNDINTTVQKLTNIMTAILRTAEVVNSAAVKISQGNLSLSQRTEEQATSLEETAASMEELTGTLQQNANNAQHVSQLATHAREGAEKGGGVVSATVHAMTEISHSNKKIANIIGVIDEIAFQTNLLALNAAVEAARAGEQGRGFAVVASEVRNLAQRSAEAAKEIKGLIKDSVVKVEEGTKLAKQSGETLKEIVLAVTKVSDLIVEIAAASQEQSSGIQLINKAIVQMDHMTQQNAALVEDAASASAVMTEQAQSLKEQVAFFKVGGLSLSQNIETQSVTHSTLQPMAEQQPPKRSSPQLHQDNEWQDF